MFRRFLCLLAAGAMLLQPIAVYAAPGVSLSQSLSDKQQQAIQADIERANTESMNQVQIDLGRVDSETIDFSHYLNKKVLTKGELEAFKWSFIFSQFARPFIDGLDDVFANDVFQQMEESDTMISSVSSILGSTQMMNILDADGYMLSSAKYKDLKDQILENLYYLTLYHADSEDSSSATPVTLNDLLSGKYQANEVFYIYDRQETMSLGRDDFVEAYYNQGDLVNNPSKYQLTYKDQLVPAVPYNSTTFLYLQIAVGTYCRQTGIDIGTLRSTIGGSYLYMDSYGNTCVYDGKDFSIIIPNFGNPFFINEELEGSTLEERIFMYNKWISTCYSDTLRNNNQAQTLDSNGVPDVVVLGGNETIDVNQEDTAEDDELKTVEVYGDSASFYLSQYLNTSQTGMSKVDKYEGDSSNMKGSLVLVDPPNISGVRATGQTPPQQDIASRMDLIASGGLSALVPTEGTRDGRNWWANTGTIISPMRGDSPGFNGDSAVSDAFPVIQANREIGKSNSYWSVVRSFASIYDEKSFSYGADGRITVSWSGVPKLMDSSGKEISSIPASTEVVSSVNNYYAVFFAFDYNKTISNPVYISCATQDDPTWAAMMFINDDIVDYGQNMDVYMEGSPKGMYLPQYRLFFTGSTDDLRESLFNGLEQLIDSPTSGNQVVFNSKTKVLGFEIGNSTAVDQLVLNFDLTDPSDLEAGVTASSDLHSRLVALKNNMDEQLGTEGIWWSKTWNSENSYENVYASLVTECSRVGLNPTQVAQAMFIVADDDFIAKGAYFLPQWYLLSRDNRYSNSMGISTVDDFVLSTYFWDRYYLSKTPFNQEMSSIIYDQTREITEEYNLVSVDWSLTPNASVQSSPDGTVTVDTSACSRQDLMNTYYNALSDNTIIFYPGMNSDTYQVKLYWSILDDLWDMLSSEPMSNKYVSINFYDMIMALQKNTDYGHNYQIMPSSSPKIEQHVSLEDLMDDAYLILTNPVKTLTTILSGLLYDVHRMFGTGTLGSSFDLNWLVTNEIYLKVSEWYVTGLVIIICAISFAKIVQYGFVQHMGTGIVVRRLIAGVLLAALPLALLQSFIFVFSFSSKEILRESMFKTLMSQTQAKQAEKVNADAQVDTELAMFKEQFEGIESAYDGLTFYIPDYYDYAKRELVYKERSLSEFIEDLKLTTNKTGNLTPVWYDSRGFVPVNEDHYDESLFYFFYDYLKSLYLNYYATNQEVQTSAMRVVAAKYMYGETDLSTLDDAALKDLQVLEQNFAKTQGNFRAMMHDSLFVYGASSFKDNQSIYGSPRVKDLWGFYKIFQDPATAYSQPGMAAIFDSDYYRWMKMQPTLASIGNLPAGVDSDNPTWTNLDLVEIKYGRDWIYTSYLDLFNPSINLDYDGTYATYNVNTPKTTPFEETLFKLNKDIYDDILMVLDYCPTQISDETAIIVSALIATFNVSETFNMEPTLPLMESVNMDMVLRTGLIKSVDNMDSSINLMYALLNEGYGFMSAISVCLVEIASASLLIIRIALIVLVIVISMFWAVWRFLTVTPGRSTQLLYGLIGNYVGIVSMHFASAFITNFMISLMSAIGTTFIGSLIILFLIGIAYLVLAAAHLFLLAWVIKNPADIGGMYIKDKVTELKAMAADRIGRLRSMTQHADDTVANADIKVSQAQLEVVTSNHEQQLKHGKEILSTLQRMNQVLSALADSEKKGSGGHPVWVVPDVDIKDVTGQQ